MLTHEHLARIAQAHGLVKTEVAAVRPTAIGVVEKLFAFLETCGGAGLAGYVNGRFASPGKDHLSLLGVPADALAATLIGIPAVFGVFGDNYGTHMASVATGLACGPTYRELFARGAAARVEQEEGKRVLSSDSKRGLGEGSARLEPQNVGEVIPFVQKSR